MINRIVVLLVFIIMMFFQISCKNSEPKSVKKQNKPILDTSVYFLSKIVYDSLIDVGSEVIIAEERLEAKSYYFGFSKNERGCFSESEEDDILMNHAGSKFYFSYSNLLKNCHVPPCYSGTRCVGISFSGLFFSNDKKALVYFVLLETKDEHQKFYKVSFKKNNLDWNLCELKLLPGYY